MLVWNISTTVKVTASLLQHMLFKYIIFLSFHFVKYSGKEEEAGNIFPTCLFTTLNQNSSLHVNMDFKMHNNGTTAEYYCFLLSDHNFLKILLNKAIFV